MRYRKKPVEIEAWQWNGGMKNFDARPDWAKKEKVIWHMHIDQLSIITLEGTMSASLGDWIIKGVKGELYPCKPEIFAETYEPA